MAGLGIENEITSPMPRGFMMDRSALKSVIGIYLQHAFGKCAQKQHKQIVIFVIFEDMQMGLPMVL